MTAAAGIGGHEPDFSRGGAPFSLTSAAEMAQLAQVAFCPPFPSIRSLLGKDGFCFMELRLK